MPASAAAAALLGESYASRILLFKTPPAADEQLLDRLHIRVPNSHELAILVLPRLGVASEAIVVEPVTEVAVQATARSARAHNATRVIVIT